MAAMPLMAQEISQVRLYPERATQVIPKEIYGQFAEHLGTCIYGGLWVGERSSVPNTDGYRNDVLQALKELSENPKGSRVLEDPRINKGFQLLVAAGIIRYQFPVCCRNEGLERGDMNWTKAIVSGSAGFVIAIVVAICIERCGGAIGGIIVSIPTTVVPTSYIFLTDNGKTRVEQAASLFATPIGRNLPVK